MKTIRILAMILFLAGLASLMSAQESAPDKDAADKLRKMNKEATERTLKAAKEEQRRLKAKQEQLAKQQPTPLPQLTPPGPPPGSAGQEPDIKEESGNLFPGESYTYKGVTLTWEVRNEDLPTTAGQVKPMGRLLLKGPTKSLTVTAPLTINSDGRGGEGNDLDACLDDVWMRVEPRGSVRGVDLCLGYFAVYKPGHRVFDAAPRGNDEWDAVSPQRPLFLNQWKLTLSDNPVKYPDGSQYLQITAANPETKEEITIPAVGGAKRKVGRFDIVVKRVSDSTRTARIVFDADVDRTIRGRDAYVENSFGLRNRETYGDFFERAAKEFGFAVEWVEFPKGHPESIEYIKGIIGNSTDMMRVTVDRLLHESFGPRNASLAFEWTDATHLRVWAKDYDKIVAENEKKAREEEEAKKKEAEEKAKEDQLWAQRREQLKQIEETFKKDYTPETRVYKLKNITPVTAKALIDPELTSSYLRFLEDRDLKDVFHIFSLSEMKRWNQDPAQTAGIHILLPEYQAREVSESCVADDKSNAVIVTAIPRSLDRVEKIIAKIDGALSVERKSVPTERHRLEVVLLRGKRAGEAASAAGEGVKLSFAVDGTMKTAPVLGMKVKQGDVIAQIHSNSVESEIDQLQLQVEIHKAGLVNARGQVEAATKRVEAGISPASEAKGAESGVLESRLGLEKAEARLAQVVNSLKLCAPFSGTVNWISPNAFLNAPVRGGDPVARLIPEKEPKSGAQPTTATAVSKLAARYGIGKEDLALFGFDDVEELGKGVVTLLADRGDMGRARVALTEAYGCELEFQDVREPYVIVRGRLLDLTAGAEPGKETGKTLLENTLFLEKGQPSLLGLTNLRQALMLVVRLVDEPPARERPAAPPQPKK